jgi:ribosomal protein S12 methylthiotransferase accessory factor
MRKFFNWNQEFRINIVSRGIVVVFSRDSFVGLYDDSAAAAIQVILATHLGALPDDRFTKKAHRVAIRFARILCQQRIMAKCDRAQWKRISPTSASFLSFSSKRGDLPSRQRLALRKLSGGPRRVVYQLSSKHLWLGSRQIVRFTAGGLVHNHDFLIPIFSSGAATSIRSATVKLIGETVERRDCATWDDEALIAAKAKSLPGPFINPTSIVCYQEYEYRKRAFPFAKFSEDEKFRWSRVCASDSNETRFVPAQFVYAPYITASNEPKLWLPTSSGVAAGRTKAEAIIRATLELVERDAAMMMWQTRRVEARIKDWETLMPSSNPCLLPGHLTVDVYAMASAIDYPCVLAAAKSRDRAGPYIAFSTAADVSWSSAVRRAVIDALLSHDWLSKEGFETIQRPQDIRRKQDHACLYGNWKFANVFSFLAAAPEREIDPISATISESHSTGAVSRLTSQLTAKGFQLWLKDLSSQSSRGLGFWVMRAIVPGFVPIQFGPAPLPNGLARLRQAKLQAGGESEFLPHPFG